jgi:hypothetical protein
VAGDARRRRVGDDAQRALGAAAGALRAGVEEFGKAALARDVNGATHRSRPRFPAFADTCAFALPERAPSVVDVSPY